jgi:hypothetical protein
LEGKMKDWTRRAVLKTSVVAPGVAAAAPEAVAGEQAQTGAPGAAPRVPASGAGRERLLLDFGLSGPWCGG